MQCVLRWEKNTNNCVTAINTQLTSVPFPGEFQLKPGQHFSSLLLSHKWLLDAA